MNLDLRILPKENQGFNTLSLFWPALHTVKKERRNIYGGMFAHLPNLCYIALNARAQHHMFTNIHLYFNTTAL